MSDYRENSHDIIQVDSVSEPESALYCAYLISAVRFSDDI